MYPAAVPPTAAGGPEEEPSGMVGMLAAPGGNSLQGGPKDLTASTLPIYREAWIEWLTRVFKGHPTDLVTLTFAPRAWECDSLGPTGPTSGRVMRAGARFEKSLTRALASPTFFIVREFGGMNGRAHLHSIVSDPEQSSTRAAIASHAAKEGFVKLSMRKISPVEYVTKYVSKSDGDWWRAGGPLFRQSAVDELGSRDVPMGHALVDVQGDVCRVIQNKTLF